MELVLCAQDNKVLNLTSPGADNTMIALQVGKEKCGNYRQKSPSRLQQLSLQPNDDI